MAVSLARAAAFESLMRVEGTDAYASEMLHSARFAGLSAADHGLLTELVMGVLRWRGFLDMRIAEHSSQAPAKMDREVLTGLRLGTYQILFLDRVPRHAAINESVELVKDARKRSAAGLVNAVLRKIEKKSSQSCSAENLRAHPQWLVERWSENFGAAIVEKICAYDQAAPSMTIRVNDAATLDELRGDGMRLGPGELLAKAFRVESGDITRTAAFRERRIAVQDEASQLVALMVGRGGSILDGCAAPGGKTRIIAERNSESEILAMELHPHRAALMKKLVTAKNVRVVVADVRQMPVSTSFDRVLVDAPCSGTGTLARNPEIKWRLREEDIARLAEYQLEILLAAMKQVSSGGRLIYSTCSLEPEENSEVIEKGLGLDSSFTLLDCGEMLQELGSSGELAWNGIDSLLSGPFLRTVPGVHPCDGFFAGVLQKL